MALLFHGPGVRHADGRHQDKGRSEFRFKLLLADLRRSARIAKLVEAGILSGSEQIDRASPRWLEPWDPRCILSHRFPQGQGGDCGDQGHADGQEWKRCDELWNIESGDHRALRPDDTPGPTVMEKESPELSPGSSPTGRVSNRSTRNFSHIFEAGESLSGMGYSFS